MKLSEISNEEWLAIQAGDEIQFFKTVDFLMHIKSNSNNNNGGASNKCLQMPANYKAKFSIANGSHIR